MLCTQLLAGWLAAWLIGSGKKTPYFLLHYLASGRNLFIFFMMVHVRCIVDEEPDDEQAKHHWAHVLRVENGHAVSRVLHRVSLGAPCTSFFHVNGNALCGLLTTSDVLNGTQDVRPYNNPKRVLYRFRVPTMHVCCVPEIHVMPCSKGTPFLIWELQTLRILQDRPCTTLVTTLQGQCCAAYRTRSVSVGGRFVALDKGLRTMLVATMDPSGHLRGVFEVHSRVNMCFLEWYFVDGGAALQVAGSAWQLRVDIASGGKIAMRHGTLSKILPTVTDIPGLGHMSILLTVTAIPGLGYMSSGMLLRTTQQTQQFAMAPCKVSWLGACSM